jgi:hypothetical protein
MPKFVLPLSAAAAAAFALASGAASATKASKLPPAEQRVHTELQNLVLKPQLPPAQGKRDAVKLVYIMVDNSLNNHGQSTLDVLKQQKKLAPTAHSLVFFDSSSHGTSLWNLGDEPEHTAVSSPLAPGLTEGIPSNSVLVMSKVFRWALQSYPAERRYLQIYSHGGAAKGVGADDSNSPYRSALQPIQGLARVLRDSSDGKPYDVVYFTACLMASVEALYEIAPSVRYAVASELPIYAYVGKGTVPVDTPLLFEELVRQGLAPEAMARTLAKRSIDKNSDGVDTIVAMDLRKLEPLVKQIAKLVQALMALSPADKVLVRQALTASRVGEKQWGVGDLWRFARALDKTVKDPAVQREVKALYRAQAGATLFEKSKAKDGTGGLSFHLPFGKLFRGYDKTRFARDTGWDRMLAAMAQAR